MPANWSEQQLREFAKADDLYVFPFYSDRETTGTPTWVWSVVVGGSLYARAYNGKDSSWYQSAAQQKAGKIKIAGIEYDVLFQPIDDAPALTEKINDSYQEKYSNSSYLSDMLEEGPVSATVLILPREHKG